MARRPSLSAMDEYLERMRDPELKKLDAALAKKGFTRDGITASNWLASVYNMQFSEISRSPHRKKENNGVSRGVMENYSRGETVKGVTTTHYICLIPHPWDLDETNAAPPPNKNDWLTVIYQKEEFKKGPKDKKEELYSSNVVGAPLSEFLKAMGGDQTPVTFFESKFKELADKWARKRQEGQAAYDALIEQLTSNNFETGQIDTRGFRKILFGDANFGSGLIKYDSIYSRSTADQTVHVAVVNREDGKAKYVDRIGLEVVWLKNGKLDEKRTGQFDLGEFMRGKPDKDDEPLFAGDDERKLYALRQLEKTIGKFAGRAAVAAAAPAPAEAHP